MQGAAPFDFPYLSELNDAQRAAVTYNDGPALVIAGAGSGKTRVLVYKLLYLIDSGYHPKGLMALTFTNKAAREMRERISQRAGAAARHIRMGTFHSVFLRILRQHASLLGYTPDFSIYNTSDSRSRIKGIIKQLGLDDKVYKPNVVHSRISSAKNRLITAEAYPSYKELLTYDAKSSIPRVAEIYSHYQRELKQANAMDFDDLLLQINILFREYPDVLREWQERIDYLLIDEYQDTNFAQYMVAKQLMQQKGKIFVVGDDAQSIYSFRGANLENILSFEKTFAGARVFKLERNYRSTQTIVAAAGRIIAQNEYQIPKAVFSEEEEALQQHRRALPHQCAEPHPRAGLPPPRHPLPRLRRALLLRPQGDHGRHRLLPPDDQRAGRGGSATHHQLSQAEHRRHHRTACTRGRPA